MYYRLILSEGHVGAGKDLELVRYFRSDNAVDLFSMAARGPRVKGKSSMTGVKLVQPVSREEYEKGVKAVSANRNSKTWKQKPEPGRIRKTGIPSFH